MEHLKIAYYFVVLLVGTAAVSYTVMMSRAYRLPFLRPFAYFLAFNNVLALINLTSAYACANLLGFCAMFQYTVFASVLGPAARLAEAGIVYALFAISRGFAGRRLSRAFDRWFGAAAGLLFVSYVVSAFLPRGGALWVVIRRGQLVVFALGALAILGVLGGLLLRSGKFPAAAERKAIRVFAGSYFVCYAVFVLTFWWPDSLQFPPNAVALLAINVFPFLWFKGAFAAAYFPAAASAEDREAFERFCRTRGLTLREAEILELILRGRTNAQIEKELFISVHTVKNHITNIHQKLGVRTRWQLVALFRAARARQPGAEPGLEEMAARPPASDLRPQ